MLTLDRVPLTQVVATTPATATPAVTAAAPALAPLGLDRFESAADVHMLPVMPKAPEGSTVPGALVQLSLFKHRRNHWQAEKVWWQAFQVSPSVADALAVATLSYWDSENKAIAADALDRATVLAKSAADHAALALSANQLGRAGQARLELTAAREAARTPADFLAFAEAASSIDHMGHQQEISDALEQAFATARTSGDYTGVFSFAAYNPTMYRELMANAMQRAVETARSSADFAAIAHFAFFAPFENRDLIRRSLSEALSRAKTGTDYALVIEAAGADRNGYDSLIQQAFDQGLAASRQAGDFVALARAASVYRNQRKDEYIHEALARAEQAAGTAEALAPVAEATAYDPLAGRDEGLRRLHQAAAIAASAPDWWNVADLARYGDPELAHKALREAYQALPQG